MKLTNYNGTEASQKAYNIQESINNYDGTDSQ